MTRGFASVGLDRVKTPANLGSVLRAAHCYGAASVSITGGRMGKYATDTMKAYRHIPCWEVADLWAAVPYHATPVVIEICERARSIVGFTHPESAFYIFGPEDGSVSKAIMERAPLIVSIPTRYCMNLAATVNVVLYDRLIKRGEVQGAGRSIRGH